MYGYTIQNCVLHYVCIWCGEKKKKQKQKKGRYQLKIGKVDRDILLACLQFFICLVSFFNPYIRKVDRQHAIAMHDI